MKKAASLILLLVVLASMVSCVRQSKGPADLEYTVGGTALEHTDELVVYFIPLMQRAFFDKTVEIFKEEHPTVNLIVEEFDLMSSNLVDDTTALQRQEQAKTRMLTELLAGTGPDIIVWFGNVPFGDLEKVMDIDIFEDLNPFFTADETFNYDEYIRGVFDAGQRGGKRLFVPISYLAPFKLTTVEAMNHYNVYFKKDMDFEHYAQELKKVYEQIETDDSRWFSNDYDSLLTYLYYLAGFRYVDYEHEVVCIDSAQLKTFLDAYGPFIELVKYRTERGIKPPQFNMGFESASLNGKRLEMHFDYVGLDNFIIEFLRLLESGQTPMVYAMPRVDGGKTAAYACNNAAVGKNSKNKVNAYEFMKLLLSEETYVPDNFPNTPFSVRMGSTERRLEKDAEMYIREHQLEAWNQISEDYLSIVTDVELVLRSSGIINMVNDSMTPYISGEKPYDECFNELDKKLRFYISE